MKKTIEIEIYIPEQYHKVPVEIDVPEAVPPPVDPVPPVGQRGQVVVVGNRLQRDGRPFTMRGANTLAPWGTAQDPAYGNRPHADMRMEGIDALAGLGANTVRIIHYADGRFPKWDESWLRQALTKCREHNIVPIIGCWDDTCSRGGPNAVRAVETFWLGGIGTRLCEEFPELVANPFNERNFDSPAQWLDYYGGFIKRARDLNLDNVIMVDAWRRCGQDPTGFLENSEALLLSDPLQQVIGSTHHYAFWVSDPPQSWQWSIQEMIPRLAACSLPIVFGEFGAPNRQDNNDYDVKALLGSPSDGISGRLAWMDLDQMPGKPFYSLWTNLTWQELTPFGKIMEMWLADPRHPR